MKTDVLNDLAFLQEHAFNFSLEVNPHAPFHNTVAEEMADNECQDWTSEQDRETAYKTGKYIEGRLYPYGSVSFYTIAGVDAAQIITACADILRKELSESAERKHCESRAFTSCDLPVSEA